MVPASVASDGRLVFGTDASYPPNEFTAQDGTTIIGMDVDLGTAVAQKLGLTPEFQNSAFSGIIPGIAKCTSWACPRSRSTTSACRPWTWSATSPRAPACGEGRQPGRHHSDNLCGRGGRRAGGTVQVDDIAARSKACTDAGKPAIEVTELQQQTDVTLALTSNRVAAMLADSPVASYAVTTTDGAVEVDRRTVGHSALRHHHGQEPGAVHQAVQGALQALIADGTYKAILEKWNVANGAITTSEIRS